MEINASYPITYPDYFNKVEYDTRTVKAVVRVNDNIQTEVVYTYDKDGNLITSVVRSHDILGIAQSFVTIV